MNKTEYRKLYKNIRNNIPRDVSIEKSDSVYQKLCSYDKFINADVVFVYLSYNNELITDRVIEHLRANNKTILIPYCNTENETMQAVVYNNKAEFKKNAYGIDEIVKPEIYNGRIDIALVPGIAFDKHGNRIGYGKGYYDKFFEKTACYKIGLAYSDTMIGEIIPHGDDDIAMDCIINDREVLEF